MDRTPSGEGRYLVVVADDFGRAASINRAVTLACDRGMVTAASIMAGGEAFDEAVNCAAEYSAKLSVGLHVTLCDGHSVLAPSRIPDLVDGGGSFEKSPFRAGVRYWRSRHTLAGQIEAEVRAQFDRVERAGIRPTHADCHHHLHMHPVLFEIIAGEAARRGVTWIRVPREPLRLIMGLHLARLDIKAFLLWAVFALLANRNLRVARRYGLRVMDNVYGLSGTGRIDEAYLLGLLRHVRGGASELYVHADLGSASGREEMRALTSGRVRGRLAALGLVLTGFAAISDQLARVALAVE